MRTPYPGPGRRVRGILGSATAGRTLVPLRDPGWCAGRPLTAGPGEGLGAGRRAPPSPHNWQTEGRRKQTHNKETKANHGGSCSPRSVRGSGDKGAAGLGWLVPRPLPPTPSNRCGLGGRAQEWETEPLPWSQAGTDVQSPRASYPSPLIIGFVTGTITALPRAWFRVACFSSLRGNSPVVLLYSKAINPIVCGWGGVEKVNRFPPGRRCHLAGRGSARDDCFWRLNRLVPGDCFVLYYCVVSENLPDLAPSPHTQRL